MHKLIAAAVTAASVVAASVPAAAHDHKPPRTQLIAKDVEQAGRLGSYCWTKAGDNPGFHERICVDAIFTWPRVQRTRAGKNARIRIFKTTAPEDLSLRSWRYVDENNYPIGNGRMREHEVRESTVDGNTVFDVTFSLPERPGPIFIEMFGTWQDTEGTENIDDAFWHFRLKLR